MFTAKCSGMSATTQIGYFPATNLPKKRNTLWQYRKLAWWFLLRWKKEKTKNREWIDCGRCASVMVVGSRAGLFDLIFENYTGFSKWQTSLIWSCIYRSKSFQNAIAFFLYYYSVERVSFESFSSGPQSHSWVCSAHECFFWSEHIHPQKYAHKASSDRHDAKWVWGGMATHMNSTGCICFSDTAHNL